MNGLLITSVTFLTTFYWRGSKIAFLKRLTVYHTTPMQYVKRLGNQN